MFHIRKKKLYMNVKTKNKQVFLNNLLKNLAQNNMKA